MKKYIVSLSFSFLIVIFFSAFIGQVEAAEGQYVIQPVYMQRSVTTSDDFPKQASNAVWYAYNHFGFAEYAVSKLTVEMISQAVTVEDRSGNTLWLATRVIRVGEAKISLHNLDFAQVCFDHAPGVSTNYNTLGTSYSPKAVNAVYGPTALGIIWNGAPRQNDTIVPAYSAGTMLVDEIIFIGIQSRFFTFDMNDPASYQMIEEYVNWGGWVGGFRLQGTVRVLSDNGEVLASATRTLGLIEETAINTKLSVRRVGDGDRIAITLDEGPENKTVVLQSAPNANGPWSVEGNLVRGGSITFPASGTKLFRTFHE